MNLFICYSKCSTCKKAREFLKEHGIPFQERDIKENRPSKNELEKWITLSGESPRKFFNTSGLVYKSMNLKDKLDSMTREEQILLLSSDGMLVKRPLLITDDKVYIGFKHYEELL